MDEVWADEFADIPRVLAARPEIRERFLQLAAHEPMPGKVTEGAERLVAFRGVLTALGRGATPLDVAYADTRRAIPPRSSPYSGDNRVFPAGWEERVVRTQVSRLYNQAVLEILREQGVTECYVPHSEAEERDSPCSMLMAGRVHQIEELLRRLVRSYREGVFERDVLKIPNHPHCTHVVRPVPQTVAPQP